MGGTAGMIVPAKSISRDKVDEIVHNYIGIVYENVDEPEPDTSMWTVHRLTNAAAICSILTEHGIEAEKDYILERVEIEMIEEAGLISDQQP